MLLFASAQTWSLLFVTFIFSTSSSHNNTQSQWECYIQQIARRIHSYSFHEEQDHDVKRNVFVQAAVTHDLSFGKAMTSNSDVTFPVLGDCGKSFLGGLASSPIGLWGADSRGVRDNSIPCRLVCNKHNHINNKAFNTWIYFSWPCPSPLHENLHPLFSWQFLFCFCFCMFNTHTHTHNCCLLDN